MVQSAPITGSDDYTVTISTPNAYPFGSLFFFFLATEKGEKRTLHLQPAPN